MILLKVITEAILRLELKCDQPECYYIPEGKILSPAAREYLQSRKIAISKDKPPVVEDKQQIAEKNQSIVPQNASFVDFETGAFFTQKPEHMTHLHGNILVDKNHPRILFRGKLDSLGSIIVLCQAEMAARDTNDKLIKDLSNVLSVINEMMRCDVLDIPFENEKIIGLNHAELRERSHNPMKFFNIKQMVLPDYTLGLDYANLNRIRTAIRETEVSANIAFRDGRKCTRPDIIEELNRLSSALHIMMCMYLAGNYK